MCRFPGKMVKETERFDRRGVPGYLRELLANAGVVRHLSQQFPYIRGEFQKLIDTPELKGGRQGPLSSAFTLTVANGPPPSPATPRSSPALRWP